MFDRRIKFKKYTYIVLAWHQPPIPFPPPQKKIQAPPLELPRLCVARHHMHTHIAGNRKTRGSLNKPIRCYEL